MISNIIEFIGRTHLVLLHFPIALLIAAAGVELLHALTPKAQRRAHPRHDAPTHAGTVIFALALLATIPAVVTGLVLGFDAPDKVDTHRILGIATGVLTLATGAALLATRRPSPGAAPRLYLALLTLSAIAVAITGHLGGDLTHGKGFLTRPLIEIFQPRSSPEPSDAIDPDALGLTPQQLQTYLTTIQPILDDNCIDCHGEEEAENDVRLDHITFVLDPDMSIVERGDPDMSDLVYLIELPPDDPDIMPPADHADPLSTEQINAIRAWVASLDN